MLASLKNWNNAEHACILSVKLVVEFLAKSYKLGIPMEDGDVDRTVGRTSWAKWQTFLLFYFFLNFGLIKT